MFRLIKKAFISAITFFNFNLSNVNSLECVSMNNQECKIRTEIINVNPNESMIYPYGVKINAKDVVILLIIHMLNYVFLIPLKT